MGVAISYQTIKLSQAIKSLKEDKELIVFPADKGSAVVVVDHDDYECTMLKEEQTYKEVKKIQLHPWKER